MTADRNTDLETVLFPVEKRPIYLCTPKGDLNPADTSTHLFGDNESDDPSYEQIPRFMAVVDVENNHVFSVVTEKYRLVTNREALTLAADCFLRVFSTATADGMEVFNITQPATRSFCHVDYVYKGHNLEPWPGDEWWPFLRVTNSYNRTKPLRFDLGFCRGICTNGIIFGKEHIVFRYYHTHDAIDAEGKFDVESTRLKALETRFIAQIHNLRRFYVPPEHMLALACKAFEIQITPSDLDKPRRKEQLVQFRSEIDRLRKKYFEEMGPNGYAALNVLTDFAARPHSYISREAMVDPLQKRCGDWTTSFLEAIKDTSFDYAKYLGAFAQSAQLLAKDGEVSE